MNFYKNKKILITGGTGMIGIALTNSLLKEGAIVTVVSLDKIKIRKKNLKIINKDLREFKNCIQLCKNKDYVFHLAGVKGSPEMTKSKPASFFVPTISFNTNILEAARRCNVKRTLYTSSIGVYNPANVFHEDDMWKKPPSNNDKFAGWAKRMGELQAEAYEIEHGKSNISIVRPANIYGPYDNFNPDNAMVIPSLIYKAFKSKRVLKVWGNGKPRRDFMFSEDCAEAMKLVLKKNINYPVNLGSGYGISIKKIAEIIKKNINRNLEIEWQSKKSKGDNIRVLSIQKLKKIGFKPRYSLEEGIKKTIDWYKINRNLSKKKYNSFLESI